MDLNATIFGEKQLRTKTIRTLVQATVRMGLY